VQDQDFHIASLLLQDQQRLIAAGKVQRWDVVKWTIAVNLALGTASVSIGKPGAGVIHNRFLHCFGSSSGGLSRFSLQQAHNRREAWF
jgi:hypothetical protein